MPENPNTDAPSRTLSTVDTAVSVVRALEELNGARVAELVDYLDLSKSTVYNHLATLRKNNLVAKDGDSYHLSLQFLLLGEYVRNQQILYQVGKEEVEALAEKTGEYAHLSTEQHGLRISLLKVRGERAVGSQYQRSKIQRPDNLHASSTGKAILAFLPRSRVGEIVDQHGLPAKTDATITDRDALFDELDAIRERGYACNDEEEIEGLRAVGAPIRDRNGTVLGALSVSGPTSRIKGEQFRDTIPEMVTSTANIIEVNMNMAARSSNAGRFD
ncbi:MULTISPECIES: IclR family transcriptional regulator [Haloferax]|uniref:Transcriptional regulator KdgR n=1 Tax=Haloferax massiliensis TaxID=1476858 RepID=A0A0D6JL62_9EURY|nr:MULTISPECIES: IclR family transcriptional regulator [Haloferax]MDS0242756.1 IclR family transcriptional regulator [Haloferax sp. S2CR25]MDS0445877.1 IclR family transcriptional regulator [Haloferax sp. S2CR25-2]CQR48652.1 Transcriptional regulator KdgR [Haloferax massiliensis]